MSKTKSLRKLAEDFLDELWPRRPHTFESGWFADVERVVATFKEVRNRTLTEAYKLPYVTEAWKDALEQARKEAAESMRERCALAALTTYKYDADAMGSRRELECSQRIADKIRSLPLED